MTHALEVGTMLIEEHPLMTQLLGLQSQPRSGRWSVISALEGIEVGRKIQAAGWNFFFMAAEVKIRFLGTLGAKNIQSGLKRILEKVRQQNFNGLEITGVVAKRFLGVPYVTISAHSRHIQHSCRLESADARQASRDAAESSKD